VGAELGPAVTMLT